ncbi:MAG: class I SAM-dependent methyltransferase [Thermoplasmata archaeon]
MITKAFWSYIRTAMGEKGAEETFRKGEEVWEYIRRAIEGGRYWQITKDEVKALYSLVAARRPGLVIETGMGPGVSTTAILSALPPNGRMISIDPGIPYGRGDREVGFVIPTHLRRQLVYVKGTSSEKLEEVLRSAGRVDVFFHDSDHSFKNVSFELNAVFPYLGEDFLIVVDNYDWSEAAEVFSRERGLRLRHVADDMAIITQWDQGR